MKPDEARKLLGGYATGTLTAVEREALMAAALEDQDLFDAIAREEALREALADPGLRAELLAAVTEPRKSRWFAGWVLPVGATAVALAGLTVFLLLRSPKVPTAAVEMADSRKAIPAEPFRLEAPLATAPPAASTLPKRRDAPALADGLRPRAEAPRKVQEAEAKSDDQRKAVPIAAPVPAPVSAPQAPAAPPAQASPQLARDQGAAATTGQVQTQQAPAAQAQQARQMPAPVTTREEAATAESRKLARSNSGIGSLATGMRASRTGAGVAIPGAGREVDASKAKKEVAATPIGVRYSRGATSVTIAADHAASLQLFRRDADQWIPFGGQMELRANAAVTIPVQATDRLVALISRTPVTDRSPATVEQLRLRTAELAVTRTGGASYVVAGPGNPAGAPLAITLEAGTP